MLFRDAGRNQAARRVAIDYAHVHHELHKSTATLEPRNGLIEASDGKREIESAVEHSAVFTRRPD